MSSLFKKAGTYLERIINEKKSVQNVVYGEDSIDSCIDNNALSAAVYAILTKLIKVYIPLSKIALKHLQVDYINFYEGIVLLYDYLFGEKVRMRKLDYRQRDFRRAIDKLNSTNILNSIKDLSNSLDHSSYRYFRVNTRQVNSNTREICKKLNLSKSKIIPKFCYQDKTTHLSTEIKSKINTGEIVIQDLSTSLACHSIYDYIIQDNPITLFDVCAGPGSKTLHFIDCLPANSRIFSIEIDENRANSIVKRIRLLPNVVEKTEVNSSDDIHVIYTGVLKELNIEINVIVNDFLKLSQTVLSNIFNIDTIDVISLDPSCSSSGIDSLVHREETERLKNLTFFQEKILSHTMKNFEAKTILYCTCSVNACENEEVVHKCLKWYAKVYEKHGKPLMQHLKTNVDFSHNNHFIQTKPREHSCRGFFLARLDRIGDNI